MLRYVVNTTGVLILISSNIFLCQLGLVKCFIYEEFLKVVSNRPTESRNTYLRIICILNSNFVLANNVRE